MEPGDDTGIGIHRYGAGGFVVHSAMRPYRNYTLERKDLRFPTCLFASEYSENTPEKEDEKWQKK